MPPDPLPLPPHLAELRERRAKQRDAFYGQAAAARTFHAAFIRNEAETERRQAQLDRIADKVDAGEPVSVEPGGYRALTDDELDRFLQGAGLELETWQRDVLRAGMNLDTASVAANVARLRAEASEGVVDELTDGEWFRYAQALDLDDWSAGDPDPGFGRPPDIPDSWRWTTLGLVVAALAVWRWRHDR